MVAALVQAGHPPSQVLDFPLDKFELAYREAAVAALRRSQLELEIARVAEASVHGGKLGHDAYVAFKRSLKQACEAAE